MDEKMMQRKYVQLQMLKQQLNMLLDEKRMINERVGELLITIDALQKLEGIKNGEEIWSTLGNSIFVRSDIKDIEKVFVGVGAGVVIKETRENAIKIIESRLDEISNADKEIVTEINKFSEQINSIEADMQKMQEKEKK